MAESDLATLVHASAMSVARAAVCVKLLKERGEDVTGMPAVETFLRIASGQILPEFVAVVAIAIESSHSDRLGPPPEPIDSERLGSLLESSHFERLGSLPLPDQRRLIDNPMVPVVQQQ